MKVGSLNSLNWISFAHEIDKKLIFCRESWKKSPVSRNKSWKIFHFLSFIFVHDGAQNKWSIVTILWIYRFQPHFKAQQAKWKGRVDEERWTEMFFSPNLLSGLMITFPGELKHPNHKLYFSNVDQAIPFPNSPFPHKFPSFTSRFQSFLCMKVCRAYWNIIQKQLAV